tara:strand:+ start:584 stop:1288 length:705 start_codon:yes stop_codon:yes gene_type:complete
MQVDLIGSINASGIVHIAPTSLFDSVLSLCFAALFGWLISNSYKYSSESIYGGKQIASSILPLSLTVCVIITVVKSSLALSLGLVGALSIVRFRTPIKDPEDLTYLFLAIVTGLGFGANQNLFTSIGISSVLLVLAIRSFLRIKRKSRLNYGSDFNINLEWDSNIDISVAEIVDVLSKNCSQISLIRFDLLKTQRNLVLQVSLFEGTNVENLIQDITLFKSEISTQIYNASIEY